MCTKMTEILDVINVVINVVIYEQARHFFAAETGICKMLKLIKV